jgi:poly-gamma-glutamate synthesis protein (capsule biosynthesis protein)
MLATGELIPARCSYEALIAAGGMDAMFESTGDAIRAADIAVSPLEVSLTDLSPPTPCLETFTLQGPAAAADAMAAVGIDVAITAGNHAMDCWEACPPGAALLDTIENLERAGLVTTGAGANLTEAREPAIFTVETLNGPVTFAFVAYDSIAAAFYAAGPDWAGTAPLETAFVREDVAAVLPIADHVIAGFGWGIEYTSDPIAFQRENAGAAIDAGATVVLGNHPHWVQAVEHFPAGGRTTEAGDALVAYSFGNFVFDQDWSTETTQGMAMDLGFTADRLIGYRIRPVVIRGFPELHRGLYRPEFVDPAGAGAPILTRIWDAQDRLPPR